MDALLYLSSPLADALASARHPPLGGGITVGQLLLSMLALAAVLVVIFCAWRYRRLKMRAGRSEIEYFPPAADPHHAPGD